MKWLTSNDCVRHRDNEPSPSRRRQSVLQQLEGNTLVGPLARRASAAADARSP